MRCLRDAVRCLEGAKANDSIAYLRFWFHNPLLDESVNLRRGHGWIQQLSVFRRIHPYARASPPIELEAVVVSCTSDGWSSSYAEPELPSPVPLSHLNRSLSTLTASSRHRGLLSPSMHMALHTAPMVPFQTQHIPRPSPVSVRRIKVLQWARGLRQHQALEPPQPRLARLKRTALHLARTRISSWTQFAT